MLKANTHSHPGRRRISAFLLFCVLAAVPGWTESTWRGQAGVSSTAGLPEAGLSAATNEFPRGTLLEVRNLRNNKSLQVQVLKRSPSALDLNFIYLSPQAGRDLEIRSGESVLVSVSVVQSATAIPGNDRPVSPSLTAPEGSLKPLTTLTLESRTGEEVVPSVETAPEAPAEVAQTSPETPQTIPEIPPSDQPAVQEVVPEVSPAEVPALAAGEEALPEPLPEPVPAPLTEETPQAVVLNGPSMEDLVPLDTPPPVRPRATSVVEEPLPEVAAAPEVATIAEETEVPRTVSSLSPGETESVPGEPGDLPSLPEAAPAAVVSNEPTELPAELPGDVPQVVAAAQPESPGAEDFPLVLPSLPETPLMAEEPAATPVVEVVQASPSSVTPTEEVPTVNPPAPAAPAAVSETQPVPAVAVQPGPAVPAAGPVASTSPVRVPGGELEKLGVQTLPRQTPTSKPQQSSAGDLYVSRPAPVTSDPLGDVKLVTSLDGRGDYIQLASYRSQDSVLKTLEKISSYIPLVLWVPEGATPVYRLVAGPLRRDQLGLVFKHYQDQGFRDAFIIKKP